MNSMNTSQFMDKQITDLPGSQNKITADKYFMYLNTHLPQEHPHHDFSDGGDGDKKDEMLPNYDFQPIRPIVSSQLSNFDSSNIGGATVWASAESKPNFGTGHYGSVEASKVVMEKDGSVLDIRNEIDRRMKKHADSKVKVSVHVLHNWKPDLENSVDDLRTDN